jgi:8-oxo-dGTP pyrophosphatase MutT (NUDIX family)
MTTIKRSAFTPWPTGTWPIAGESVVHRDGRTGTVMAIDASGQARINFGGTVEQIPFEHLNVTPSNEMGVYDPSSVKTYHGAADEPGLKIKTSWTSANTPPAMAKAVGPTIKPSYAHIPLLLNKPNPEATRNWDDFDMNRPSVGTHVPSAKGKIAGKIWGKAWGAAAKKDADAKKAAKAANDVEKEGKNAASFAKTSLGKKTYTPEETAAYNAKKAEELAAAKARDTAYASDRAKYASDYATRDLHAEGAWEPQSRDSRYGTVMFDGKGHVLLREPKGHFDGINWSFAKGHPDREEHPSMVAMRETEEETGFTPNLVGHVPGGFKTTPGYGTTKSVNHYYLAEPSEKPFDGSMMNGETQKLVWATPQQADDMMAEGKNVGAVHRDRTTLRAAVSAYEQARPQVTKSVPLSALEPLPPPAPKPAFAPKPAVAMTQVSPDILKGGYKGMWYPGMPIPGKEDRNWHDWDIEHPYSAAGYGHQSPADRAKESALAKAATAKTMAEHKAEKDAAKGAEDEGDKAKNVHLPTNHEAHEEAKKGPPKASKQKFSPTEQKERDALKDRFTKEAKSIHTYQPGGNRAKRFEKGYTNARMDAHDKSMSKPQAHDLKVAHEHVGTVDEEGNAKLPNPNQAEQWGAAAGYHAHSIAWGDANDWHNGGDAEHVVSKPSVQPVLVQKSVAAVPKEEPKPNVPIDDIKGTSMLSHATVGKVYNNGYKVTDIGPSHSKFWKAVTIEGATGTSTVHADKHTPMTKVFAVHEAQVAKQAVQDAHPNLEDATVNADVAKPITPPIGHLGDATPKTENDLKQMKELKPGEHFSNGEKVPNAGSNGGKWYEDNNGKGYLVKGAQSDEHAMNDVAGALAYEHAGIRVPKVTLLKDNSGNLHAVSHYIPGLTPVGPKNVTEDVQADARKGAGMDALMSHYDLTGLPSSHTPTGIDGNNLFKDKDGNVVRLDLGGTGRFRAQGAKKDSWGEGDWQNHVHGENDYETIRKFAQGQIAYGHTPQGVENMPEDMKQSLSDAAHLDTDKYHQSMLNAGISKKFADEQVSVIKSRQAHLTSNVLHEEPKVEEPKVIEAPKTIEPSAANAIHNPSNTVTKVRLEYHAGTSNKFYESSVEDHGDGTASHVTKYGSTLAGAHHTTNVTEHPNVESAIHAHSDIVSQKYGKGYNPVGAAAGEAEHEAETVAAHVAPEPAIEEPSHAVKAADLKTGDKVHMLGQAHTVVSVEHAAGKVNVGFTTKNGGEPFHSFHPDFEFEKDAVEAAPHVSEPEPEVYQPEPAKVNIESSTTAHVPVHVPDEIPKSATAHYLAGKEAGYAHGQKMLEEPGKEPKHLKFLSSNKYYKEAKAGKAAGDDAKYAHNYGFAHGLNQAANEKTAELKGKPMKAPKVTSGTAKASAVHEVTDATGLKKPYDVGQGPILLKEMPEKTTIPKPHFATQEESDAYNSGKQAAAHIDMKAINDLTTINFGQNAHGNGATPTKLLNYNWAIQKEKADETTDPIKKALFQGKADAVQELGAQVAAKGEKTTKDLKKGFDLGNGAQVVSAKKIPGSQVRKVVIESDEGTSEQHFHMTFPTKLMVQEHYNSLAFAHQAKAEARAKEAAAEAKALEGVHGLVFDGEKATSDVDFAEHMADEHYQEGYDYAKNYADKADIKAVGKQKKMYEYYYANYAGTEGAKSKYAGQIGALMDALDGSNEHAPSEATPQMTMEQAIHKATLEGLDYNQHYEESKDDAKGDEFEYKDPEDNAENLKHYEEGAAENLKKGAYYNAAIYDAHAKGTKAGMDEVEKELNPSSATAADDEHLPVAAKIEPSTSKGSKTYTSVMAKNLKKGDQILLGSDQYHHTVEKAMDSHNIVTTTNTTTGDKIAVGLKPEQKITKLAPGHALYKGAEEADKAAGYTDTIVGTGDSQGIQSSVSTVKPPKDFEEAFSKAFHLKNWGVTEQMPQKVVVPDHELEEMPAHKVGARLALLHGKEMSPEDAEQLKSEALALKESAISPAAQAAALGTAKGYEAAHAPVPEEDDPDRVIPLDQYPEFGQGIKDAKADVASGATSKDLYAKAGKLAMSTEPEKQAEGAAYQSIAEQLDQAENAVPQPDLNEGHAPLNEEQIEAMKEKATQGKGLPLASPTPLHMWAYDQGRAQGLMIGNIALGGGLTASDIEHGALSEEELAKSTVGLQSAKHWGAARMLHRVALSAYNGEGQITSNSNVLTAKPDVAYYAPGSLTTPGHNLYGNATEEADYTADEKAAFHMFTGPFRFSSSNAAPYDGAGAGKSSGDFYAALNTILGGMQTATPDSVAKNGAYMARVFLNAVNTKSVPSQMLIYRGTQGHEWKAGEFQKIKDTVAKGQTATFSLPISSMTYNPKQGIYESKPIHYFIDQGALTMNGTFTHGAGEAETNTGGLMEIYKISKMGTKTVVYMRQLVHYAN